jgi:plasmid replication initiation protein
MKKNVSIVKANKLIETNYKLGKRELLWILMQISEINANPVNGDVVLPTFKMYGSQIVQRLNFDGVRRISEKKEVFEIMNNLNNSPIRWEEGTFTGQVTWINYMQYDSETDLYTWGIPEQLTPFLLKLKDNFTKYLLHNVIELKSAHAINLYEILKRYQFKQTVTVSLSQLKFWLGLEDAYPKWSDFKRRVLMPCQTQINAFTDICFEYEMIKNGRKVCALQCTIQENPKYAKTVLLQQVAAENRTIILTNNEPTPKNVKDTSTTLQQQLHTFGFNNKTIKRIINNYDSQKITAAIAYTESASGVHNKAAYIIEYLQGSWANNARTLPQKQVQKQAQKQANNTQKAKIIAQLNADIATLKREHYKQKLVIYQQLCTNKSILQEAYNRVRAGVFGNIMQDTTPESCFDNDLLKNAIYAKLEKIYPQLFTDINKAFTIRIKEKEQQITYYQKLPASSFTAAP